MNFKLKCLKRKSLARVTNLLVLSSDINKAITSKHHVLLMVVKEALSTSFGELELTSEISSLLCWFQDVFQEEIPEGTPTALRDRTPDQFGTHDRLTKPTIIRNEP